MAAKDKDLPANATVGCENRVHDHQQSKLYQKLSVYEVGRHLH